MSKFEFTVDRSKWLRGEDDESMLLRKCDNKMCCLGFFALACGLTRDEISGKSTPSSLAIRNIKLPSTMQFLLDEENQSIDSRLGNSMMATNDSKNINDDERERQLKLLFEQVGIEILFED